MPPVRLCLIVTLLLGASALWAHGRPVPKTQALVGGTLVDGFAGPPIQNSVVLIDGDQISAVGKVGSLAVPAGAEVIPTEGMTVLPGLWDMHVHTMIVGHADYDTGTRRTRRSSSRSSCRPPRSSC